MSPRSLAARLLLPRYAAGGLGARASAFVAAALAADAALAHDYDALRRAEALSRRHAGHAGHAGLSAGQLDGMETRLLAGAGAAVRMQQEDVARTRRTPWPMRAAPLALAAACTAAFVVVANRGDDVGYSVGALEARGARMARDPLGLRVSCVVGGVVVDDATAGARRASDVLACPTGAMLAFATTNLSAENRYVFVLGVARDGELRWFSPFKRGGAALALVAGQQHRVFDEMADTRGMPDDASVSLHVLFSDEPFSSDDVERQVALAKHRGVPLASIDKLPLVGVPMQARIDLRRP